MRWAAEATAIFAREIRSELRTRVALSGTLLFTVCTLALVALAMHGSTASSPELAAALLWVILFFAASVGLARTFVQEEERGTALLLRLTARASCVWAGKFAANAALLGILTLLTAPILLGLLEVNVQNIGLLIAVLILGTVGLAAVFTTTGALVAQANAGTGLLAALSFPLLMPLLASGVHGVQAAFGFADWAKGTGDLQVLGSYAVVAITASLMTFEYVWND